MSGVLDGIRVIDFGRYIAGPFATAIMADMGAEVIRVEKLSGGEDRYIAPLEDGTGAGYLQSNRNKRGMTLNPLKPEGREVAKRLIASADIIAANLPPEPAPQPGMALQAQSPDGQPMTLIILEVGDEAVKVDGNHPLAGEDVTFELTLRDIKQAA